MSQNRHVDGDFYTRQGTYYTLFGVFNMDPYTTPANPIISLGVLRPLPPRLHARRSDRSVIRRPVRPEKSLVFVGIWPDRTVAIRHRSVRTTGSFPQVMHLYLASIYRNDAVRSDFLPQANPKTRSDAGGSIAIG